MTERRTEFGLLSKSLSDCEASLDITKNKVRDTEECIVLAQSFSGSLQTDVVDKFEDLLTRAVRQVFGRDYTVHLVFEAKGNSFWADFHVTLPSGRRVTLSHGEGGGLKDLCSVLIRMLYLILDPTCPSRVVFLDENLSNLDSWRSPGGLTMLARIMSELGVQALWITHSDAVRSGEVSIPGARVLRMSMSDNVSACTGGPQ